MKTFREFLNEKKGCCETELINSYSPKKGGEPYIKLEKVVKGDEEQYVVTCDAEGIKEIFDDEIEAQEFFDETLDKLDI